MLNAYVYDGVRSAFARHAGALASLRADDMAGELIKTLVERSAFPQEEIEDVLLGCTSQAGEDSRNIARNALLLAGLPVSVAGQTVNRLCSSGLAAALDAARAIHCGDGQLYVAGGVESMSRAPFVVAKAEMPYSRDFKVYDSTIGARFPNPRLSQQYGQDSMVETGDNVAVEFAITREQADRFAAYSQIKYAKAKADDFFVGEIHPLEVSTGRKTPPTWVNEDEHPRASSTLEKLTTLKPLFADGVVTAGNASGINDGACVLLLGNAEIGQQYDVKPMVRIVAGAAIGVAPRIMGIGPAYAIPKALQRANLTLDDMDIIEINEAFASQVLSCLKLLKVDFQDERVNPNGGAIAVGHPLGASGARLLLTTARELQRRQGRYAVISLCIGVGQGLAVVIERVQK